MFFERKALNPRTLDRLRSREWRFVLESALLLSLTYLVQCMESSWT